MGSLRHNVLTGTALVTLGFAALAPCFGQGKGQYEKARFVGWAEARRDLIYSTPEISYGSGVKSPPRTTVIPRRFLRVEIEAADAIYLIEARKWEFDVGQEVEFRRINKTKNGKSIVSALVVRHADGKEKKYAVLGVRVKSDGGSK